jgi:hypothetical protein
MAAWIEFVKDYAQKNNTSFGNAMKDENCKKNWKAKKGISSETKFKNSVLDDLKKSEIKKKDILKDMENKWESEVKNKKESRKKKSKSLTKSKKKPKVLPKAKTVSNKKIITDHFMGLEL